MRHVSCALALLVLAAPAASAQPAFPPPATAQQQMAGFFDRVNAAMARADGDALAAMFTVDGEYRDRDRLNAAGRDSLRSMFAEMLAARGPAPPFTAEAGTEAIPAGEFVFVRGVYSLLGSDSPTRVGYAGLMQQTDAGLVARHLTEFPAEASPEESAEVRPTVAHLVYVALMDGGIGAAQARHRALRAAAPAFVRFGEPHLNALGYRLLERGSVPEAVAVFEMNVEAYPDAANAHDSLGEGLAAAGRADDARAAYARAVSQAEAQGDPRLATYRANLARATPPAAAPR